MKNILLLGILSCLFFPTVATQLQEYVQTQCCILCGVQIYSSLTNGLKKPLCKSCKKKMRGKAGKQSGQENISSPFFPSNGDDAHLTRLQKLIAQERALQKTDDKAPGKVVQKITPSLSALLQTDRSKKRADDVVPKEKNFFAEVPDNQAVLLAVSAVKFDDDPIKKDCFVWYPLPGDADAALATKKEFFKLLYRALRTQEPAPQRKDVGAIQVPRYWQSGSYCLYATDSGVCIKDEKNNHIAQFPFQIIAPDQELEQVVKKFGFKEVVLVDPAKVT